MGNCGSSPLISDHPSAKYAQVKDSAPTLAVRERMQQRAAASAAEATFGREKSRSSPRPSMAPDEEDANRIRAFKSAHYEGEQTASTPASPAPGALRMTLQTKSRGSSLTSSFTDGGLAGETLGQALKTVMRDGRNDKQQIKSRPSQGEPSLPGVAATPRESTTGDVVAKPCVKPTLSQPTSCNGAGPKSAPSDLVQHSSEEAEAVSPSIPLKSTPPAAPPPQEDEPSDNDSSHTSAPKEGKEKRRAVVTFEPQAAAAADLSTRGMLRNKSRLGFASQNGTAPGADVPAAAADNLQSQRSLNHKRPPLPPPPDLPIEPALPAAKGGESEPGLWVLRRTGVVRHKYILADALGRGQFGAVCVAMDRGTGERWACKSVSKRRVQGMHDFSMSDVLREVEVLYTVGGHPGVVGLKEVYEDEEDLHLVLELCQGGDWFERLINFGRYTEAEAAGTIRSVLEALSYCHSLGVMHRDIKPENIMFVDRTEASAVKLTDFGLAALFTDGGAPLTEVLGSAYYVAPEVLRESYSKEADVWSTGVVLFIALGGYAPFDGANEREVFYKILHEPLKFKDSSWSHISTDAKQVLSWMLHKDPKQRATVKELLAHPWFATCAGTIFPDGATTATAAPSSPTRGAPVSLDPTLTQRMPKGSVARAVATAVKKGKTVKPVPDAVVARLQQFSAMNAFKRQARRVLATYLPEEEVVGLMQVFQAMDKDGDGLLTVAELQQGLEDRGILVSDKNAQLLLKRADLDRDGCVDYGEFLAATLHLARLERDERLYKAFRYFDKDNSGFITRDELEQGLQHLGKVNVDRILAEVDKDGDGRICYKEFCDMLRYDTEPSLQIFSDNALDCTHQWGAWGEATESGRLVLAVPESTCTSRAISLANSRNVSINDRTSRNSTGANSSLSGLGAVSIRRSLGGNLLFGSRNARASGTGQQMRTSLGGGRGFSVMGSSRFGSMRNAAYQAVLAVDAERSNAHSADGHAQAPRPPLAALTSHKSAGPLTSRKSGNRGSSNRDSDLARSGSSHAQNRHVHDARMLEVVTESDGSVTSKGVTPKASHLEAPQKKGAADGEEKGSVKSVSGKSENMPLSPFALTKTAHPPAPATPYAWAEGSDARAAHPVPPRPSPRNRRAANQKPASTTHTKRSSSEHGMVSADGTGPVPSKAVANYRGSSPEVPGDMQVHDPVLWRQIREMAGAAASDHPPKSPQVTFDAAHEDLKRKVQSCTVAPK